MARGLMPILMLNSFFTSTPTALKICCRILFMQALGCVFCSCCGHVGNALALSKLCGTQSGMSTAFAAPSSRARRDDAGRQSRRRDMWQPVE